MLGRRKEKERKEGRDGNGREAKIALLSNRWDIFVYTLLVASYKSFFWINSICPGQCTETKAELQETEESGKCILFLLTEFLGLFFCLLVTVSKRTTLGQINESVCPGERNYSLISLAICPLLCVGRKFSYLKGHFTKSILTTAWGIISSAWKTWESLD